MIIFHRVWQILVKFYNYIFRRHNWITDGSPQGANQDPRFVRPGILTSWQKWKCNKCQATRVQAVGLLPNKFPPKFPPCTGHIK